MRSRFLPRPVRQNRCVRRASSSQGGSAREDEVVEQVLAQLELGQHLLGDDEQHGPQRVVTLAQATAKGEGSARVVEGRYHRPGETVLRFVALERGGFADGAARDSPQL